MNVLEVNEDDLVLIKSSDVRANSKYSIPLIVRRITSTTKLKCYYFKDFMTQKNIDRSVRFYFDSEENAFSFLFNQLTSPSEWDMKTPFYFGVFYCYYFPLTLWILYLYLFIHDLLMVLLHP